MTHDFREGKCVVCGNSQEAAEYFGFECKKIQVDENSEDVSAVPHDFQGGKCVVCGNSQEAAEYFGFECKKIQVDENSEDVSAVPHDFQGGKCVVCGNSQEAAEYFGFKCKKIQVAENSEDFSDFLVDDSTIYDPDLNSLLEECSGEDLIPLRDYLLKNCTNTLKFFHKYRSFPNKPHRYLGKIIEELKLMGGNSIANYLFRLGEGVCYKEIVSYVAEKIGVTGCFGSVESYELGILKKVFKDMYGGMSDNQKKELEKIIWQSSGKFQESVFKKSLGVLLTQAFAKGGGFATYKLSVIVANQVAKMVLGHGLRFAANASITKTIGFLLGPIGWSITGLWTAIDIAGPANRTIIPCVLHIAYLRQKMKFNATFGE